jgi:hypothetical protein
MDEIYRKFKVSVMLSTQRWIPMDELASLSRRKQGFESPRERQSFQEVRGTLKDRRGLLPIFCLLSLRIIF